MDRTRAPDRRAAPKRGAKQQNGPDEAEHSGDDRRKHPRPEPRQGADGIVAGLPQRERADGQHDDAERAVRDPPNRLGLEESVRTAVRRSHHIAPLAETLTHAPYPRRPNPATPHLGRSIWDVVSGTLF